jgi:HK97 family phage prohead protease
VADIAERRKEKLRKKSGDNGFEISVASGEFSIDKKAAEGKPSGDGFVYFEGYASIFNTPDSYKDIILPGAFKKTIKEKGPKVEKKSGRVSSEIKALWQHNPDWPFGLPQHLEEDSKGLYHRTKISNSDENMDRLQYMEEGIVTGESIGFMTTDFEWDEEDEDDWWPARIIKGIDLWEISPVTFAAHSDAVTTLIQRNRELALAVRNIEHGGVMATAYKMKSISAPMVEQAISVLTSLKEALPEETPDDEENVVQLEETPEVEEVDNPPENDDEPDTSEEDPVLVEALESFALELELEQRARKLEKEAM